MWKAPAMGVLFGGFPLFFLMLYKIEPFVVSFLFILNFLLM
jgi:hypothetical protein